MNRQRPVALGYVAARGSTDTAAQRNLVTAYASAEGLALADVLDDHRDALTISQIAETARLRGATAVIVPGQSRLASAYARLAYELEQHGIRSVLIGATPDKPVIPGRIMTSPASAVARSGSSRTPHREPADLSARPGATRPGASSLGRVR